MKQSRRKISIGGHQALKQPVLNLTPYKNKILSLWKSACLLRRCSGSISAKIPYIYYNFSRVCPPAKSASKTTEGSVVICK